MRGDLVILIRTERAPTHRDRSNVSCQLFSRRRAQRVRFIRRLLVCALSALTLGLATPTVAGASVNPRASVEDLQWARRLNFYYFGSSANPLQHQTCGRQFGDVFILTQSVEGGQERSCTIARGQTLLATPGGTISWAPTDGTTPAELRSSCDEAFATLTGAETILDGNAVPRVAVKSFVHPMKLQPGNFAQAVDPAVTGHSTL